MNAKEVLGFAKSKSIEMVDLKFMDFIGTWQHFAVPIYELKEDSFEEGFGFDGSSIRGKYPANGDGWKTARARSETMTPWRDRATR